MIACYSDPGLHVCREGTDRPVFGIAECGVLTAMTRAETFGVIAIAQRSIRRHIRYLRQMGLMDRLAGEGVAVLMISSDLEEVLGMSDRVLVLHRGRLAGELPRARRSEEAIMHLATGGETVAAAQAPPPGIDVGHDSDRAV